MNSQWNPRVKLTLTSPALVSRKSVAFYTRDHEGKSDFPITYFFFLVFAYAFNGNSTLELSLILHYIK